MLCVCAVAKAKLAGRACMKFEYFYSSSFLFIFIWLVNGLVNPVALHTIFVSSTFLCTLLSRTFIITREAD